MRVNTKKAVRALAPRSLRNWMRSPSASARWMLDELKFAAGITEAVQMRDGWSVACHPAAYRGAYHAQHDDTEQVAEFNSFLSCATAGMVFFDLGAHFGLFSLAALHYGGPEARAVAVDPSPTAARMLRLQAKLNGVAERLQVVEASVGERTGRQPMVDVGVLASGYYVAPSGDHPASELRETSAVTLDDLVNRSKASPTHVKIDVEGYEAAVLRGGRRLLTGPNGPLLFIELHNRIIADGGGDPKETLALLENAGYRTFDFDSRPLTNEAILERPLIRVVARK